MSERLAVIGAGAAGLAAAWRLSAAGRAVVVYEASAVAGGLLATTTRGSVHADSAVQLFSSTYTQVHALASGAGAGGLLVHVDGRDALWRKGRVHPITYGAVSSMAASGALPTMLKLRLAAKYVPFLATRASKLDANDLAGTATAHDGESIAAWGRRELGDDFVEYLSYPLLAAYYGTEPEQASAGLYHALARVGMDVKLSAVRGGAARLVERVVAALQARGVELHAGTPVEAVSGTGAAVRVRAGDSEHTYGGVVLATPPAEAARLAGEHQALAEWLGGVRTAPAVTLTAWLSQRVPVEYFGVSVPRLEPPGDVLVAACVQSRKPGMAEEGGDAVVAFPSPRWLAAHAASPAGAVAEALVPALERLLPGVGRVIEDVSVHRHGGGYRVFGPGTLRRLAAFDARMQPAGWALAGDYLVAPTVEGAVRSGFGAAARLLG